MNFRCDGTLPDFFPLGCACDQLCLTFCNPMDCPWNSLGTNTGVGCHSLLQGIFPTQGSKCLLNYEVGILDELSLVIQTASPSSKEI